MSEKIGVLLCGHGSRDEDAIRQFAAVAAGVARRLPQYDVDHGFLEFARPVIRTGLDGLLARGSTRILAVPGMLFAAGHAKNDIPSVLNAYAAGRADARIDYGRDLGLDAGLLGAAAERIEGALEAAAEFPRAETALVVVGRGTSDPDANSNIAKIMRMLWEGLGFGWGETAYSGVTFPLVAPVLDHVARLGYRRVVVFPYFLFTGVLVKRIYAHTAEAAARHPEIEFVTAPYLNDHPAVIDALVARIHEVTEGTGNMNCQMCKYREPLPGFEDQVGLAQQSHHHHVEGIGTGGGGNGSGRDHGHHHPYPHADHPLGPRSLDREADKG
jgi:sirohydrochlorin cobaltochelatase